MKTPNEDIHDARILVERQDQLIYECQQILADLKRDAEQTDTGSSD